MSRFTMFNFMCMTPCFHICVYTKCVLCSWRPEEGNWSVGTGAGMWVLETKPSSSARLSSTLYHRTISPALLVLFSWRIFFVKWDFKVVYEEHCLGLGWERSTNNGQLKGQIHFGFKYSSLLTVRTLSWERHPSEKWILLVVLKLLTLNQQETQTRSWCAVFLATTSPLTFPHLPLSQVQRDGEVKIFQAGLL